MTIAISTSTQNTSQAPEKEEIWSTILTGVASSKMVPTKKVIILGDPGSGKSTLTHFLKNDPGPQKIQNDNEEVPTAMNTSFGANNDYIPVITDTLDDDATSNLALGYSFVDVQDEENEVHRIEEISKEGSASESWSKGKAIIDELREKIEHYIQTYTEPVSSNTFTLTASTSTGSIPSTPTPFISTPLITTTTSADQVTLPLSQGTLTTNLGLPIVIVCCKSDAMNMLEQTMDYKDEQFDFIQQTLRCICMKFGAALFYTSTLQPYTYHNLRQYILHRLLTTPTKSYLFQLKAQVVERDTALVPSGWDSWGKLRVLREGYDCESIHLGWDADMDAVADRQQPGFHGARGIYEDTIADLLSKDQPLSNIPPPVTCEDEQAFLERHFETLQHVSELPNRKGTGAQSVIRPSVVGPLSIVSSTFDLVRNNDDSRIKDMTTEKAGKSVSFTNPSPITSSTATTTTIPPIDTNLTSAGNTQTTGPSHEVLANFFQSLLSKKATGGSSPTTASLLSGGIGGARDESHNPSSVSPVASSGTTRRPTVSRKDVHKELDRMRQYVNKP
ncbi:dynein light intermediate chain-domain-containing protein [Pilobolus umbonatus]|nr:dynein light intermediate chain-domain-containing protein [Pilobolus umbonatus]